MGWMSRLIIGAMSGTSGDGVDAALVEIIGHGTGMSAVVRQHVHVPYKAEVRSLFFLVRSGGYCQLTDIAAIGREVSLAYARAVHGVLRAARISASEIACIAAHGQTLFHSPPNTIQWIDPSLVAAETGCAVVSDFRRADCAVGGQGAPLVPFADFLLFRHSRINRVMLNLGGIANITWLKAGGSLSDVIAFDTGPANCISDHLMRSSGNGTHDPGGEKAMRGVADEAWVGRLMDDPYFSKPPPKSTDGPEMIALFEQTRIGLPTLEDQLASAAAWVGASVAQACASLAVDEIILSGGGTANQRICQEIRRRCGCSVIPLHDLGMQSEAKEAVAFALLAAATLDGVPSNVPSVTGAKKPMILGSITPQPIG